MSQTDEDMRSELQNIQMQANQVTDEVSNHGNRYL